MYESSKRGVVLQMSAIVQVKAERSALAAALEQSKPTIAQLLPPDMSADKLIHVVISAVSRSPQILTCERGSIVRAVLQGAECGLEIGGVFGEAYLVPFWNNKERRRECQFIAGYKGLIKLALQSERVRNIGAELVYEGDVFRRVLGTNPILVHEPSEEKGVRTVDRLTHAYCVAFFETGGNQFEVMSRDELDLIRGRSKAKDKDTGQERGPWATDTLAMYRKAPVRSIMRFLQLSTRAKRALEYDQEATLQHPARSVIGDSRTDALKARLVGATPETPVHEFDAIVEIPEEEK